MKSIQHSLDMVAWVKFMREDMREKKMREKYRLEKLRKKARRFDSPIKPYNELEEYHGFKKIRCEIDFKVTEDLQKSVQEDSQDSMKEDLQQSMKENFESSINEVFDGFTEEGWTM